MCVRVTQYDNNVKFSDSHCHLDFANFDENRLALLKECAKKQINRIVLPGVIARDWSKILATVDGQQLALPALYPALGIHPWYVEKSNLNDLVALEKTLKERKGIIAVGEIGLDGYINDMDNQLLFFEKQLDIAAKHNLPVIIHHRKSHHLLQPILKKKRLARAGVIHGFSGNYQQAKPYLDLGFKLGIGGTITYDRATKTQETVAKLPLDSMLLETDAPSMPIQGHQGHDNSPIRIIDIFDHLCHIRQEPAQLIAEQIEANFDQLFF